MKYQIIPLIYTWEYQVMFEKYFSLSKVAKYIIWFEKDRDIADIELSNHLSDLFISIVILNFYNF